MFIRRKIRHGKTYHALVENFREYGKVKQRTIMSLGDLETAIDRLKGSPEYNHLLSELLGEERQKKIYKCLLVDPPWFENGGGGRGANSHYPLMKTEDIIALGERIKPVIDENAHLYLWTTNNFLPDALRVAESWGFRYITSLTWFKTNGIGLGQYFRGTTEQLLFCVRGTLAYKKTRDGRRAQETTAIFAPKTRRHSEKPKEVYSLIQTVSYGPYLELFARSRQPKWDSWGNEFEGDINL